MKKTARILLALILIFCFISLAEGQKIKTIDGRGKGRIFLTATSKLFLNFFQTHSKIEDGFSAVSFFPLL